MNKNYKQENEEVLYSNGALTIMDRSDIKYIKRLSEGNHRKRIRLCVHSNQTDPLHEMLIVHDKNTYVRPHKHPGKSESTHIIEGLVDIVLFDDSGKIERVISMGNYASGKIFYYRLATPIYHMLVIRSEVLVFHETTNGPFDRADTVFAPWAPEYENDKGVADFISGLEKKINIMQLAK